MEKNNYQRIERIVRKYRYEAKLAVDKIEGAAWMIKELIYLRSAQEYLPSSQELAKLAREAFTGSKQGLKVLEAYVLVNLQRRKDFTDCFWNQGSNLVENLSRAGVLKCVLWNQAPDPDGVNDDYGPVRDAIYTLTDPTGFRFTEELEKRIRKGNSPADYLSELSVSNELIDYYYERVEVLQKKTKTRRKKSALLKF